MNDNLPDPPRDSGTGAAPGAEGAPPNTDAPDVRRPGQDTPPSNPSDDPPPGPARPSSARPAPPRRGVPIPETAAEWEFHYLWPRPPGPVAALQTRDDGSRDEAAWGRLYRHYDPLFRQSLVGRRIHGRRLRRDDVDDIVSDVWRRVERFIDGFRGSEDELPAWLRRVATSAFYSEVRRRRAAAAAAAARAAAAPQQEESRRSEDARAAEVAELREWLRRVGGVLPPRDQSYLERYLDGATHEDLARDEGYAHSQISHQRLHRIVKRLRRAAAGIGRP